MRLDDAEAAYRSAIAHRPNMADTWYNLWVHQINIQKMNRKRCSRYSFLKEYSEDRMFFPLKTEGLNGSYE